MSSPSLDQAPSSSSPVVITDPHARLEQLFPRCPPKSPTTEQLIPIGDPPPKANAVVKKKKVVKKIVKKKSAGSNNNASAPDDGSANNPSENGGGGDSNKPKKKKKVVKKKVRKSNAFLAITLLLKCLSTYLVRKGLWV